MARGIFSVLSVAKKAPPTIPRPPVATSAQEVLLLHHGGRGHLDPHLGGRGQAGGPGRMANRDHRRWPGRGRSATGYPLASMGGGPCVLIEKRRRRCISYRFILFSTYDYTIEIALPKTNMDPGRGSHPGHQTVFHVSVQPGIRCPTFGLPVRTWPFDRRSRWSMFEPRTNALVEWHGHAALSGTS